MQIRYKNYRPPAEFISESRASCCLKHPIISEKSTRDMEQNVYTFCVEKSACKEDVKLSFEKMFKVQVAKVTTLNVPSRKKLFRGRPGVRSSWKKARIFLKNGEKKIDFMGGDVL